MNRNLKSRQVQMIALGGTIGVGLFMGTNSSIKWTGPSVLLAYALAGAFLYLIMRALGEMLYIDPSTGSFAKYASEYIHPFFGYLTAWSNVFQWVLVGMSEMIALGGYFAFWWPNLPQWIPGLVALIIICLANLTSVKAFGEMEFWFALVKVVTIIFMIIAGCLLIFFGIGNDLHPVGLSNLWTHGFFTGGWKGFLFSLAIVVGSYQGMELIGVSAGETEDPQKTLVDAIKSMIWRILIFYVGAIFVILCIYPWDELGQVGSPFVQTFAKFGIPIAAGLINFVVITAALSGANSGIYSSSRMLYTLGFKKQLPRKFTLLNNSGVPVYSVLAVSCGILLGVILNVVLPLFYADASSIFVKVFSASILPGMVPWFVILISQLKFRKIHQSKYGDHPFKMPLSPYSNYFTLLFLLVVLVFMFLNKETRISIIIGVFFMIFMAVTYFVKYHGKTSEDK